MCLWNGHRLDLDADNDYGGDDEIDATNTFTLANAWVERDIAGKSKIDLAHDPVGNMTDDGEHYKYVYDPFGRLRKVLKRTNDDLVAEYRYNGLNQRITAHFDTNLDTVVDGSDVVSHFAYDARWRIVARYEDANSDPTEQFVFHHAGLASTGSGSYIDAVMLRDRDTTANGTLDERVYHLHNWRSDVVALISHAGSQIEQVRYEPYGTPFGIPAGDIDADGKVTQDDLDQATAWYSGTAYDVRADLDMNGSVNLSDITYIAGNKFLNHETGRGVLSLEHIGSRKGYASYEHLAELEGSGAKWDVRNRVLLSDIGGWNRRDPIGYVDGPSLYSYVSEDPISHLDPWGYVSVVTTTTSFSSPLHAVAPSQEPIATSETELDCQLWDSWCRQACDNKPLFARSDCYRDCSTKLSTCYSIVVPDSGWSIVCWPMGLLTHCEVRMGCNDSAIVPSDQAKCVEYPIGIVRGDCTRSLPDGTPCCRATIQDIQKCLSARAGWRALNYWLDDNCQTSSGDAVRACCGMSRWKPSWYIHNPGSQDRPFPVNPGEGYTHMCVRWEVVPQNPSGCTYQMPVVLPSKRCLKWVPAPWYVPGYHG